MPAPAAVVITTRNRKDDLRKAVQSVVTQTVASEIIVIDDGSTDNTSEMVQKEFPSVRLVREEQSVGYIVRRNEAARLTTAPIIFSLDDDAAFSSPTVIEQTLREFDHPAIGAVSIPYVDVMKTKSLNVDVPADGRTWITYSYVGTAHALRRDVFLKLNGYRESLFHQGEERDYCVRMLNQGYFVRLGRADPIHHFESPKRDFGRVDFYGSRNAILYAIHNVPAIYLLPNLIATTLNRVRHGLRLRRSKQILKGTLAGYVDALRYFHERDAVSPASYQLSRRLLKKMVTLEDIARTKPISSSSGA